MSGKGGFVNPNRIDDWWNQPKKDTVWVICSSCKGKGVINCHPAIGTCGTCHGTGKVRRWKPYDFVNTID